MGTFSEGDTFAPKGSFQLKGVTLGRTNSNQPHLFARLLREALRAGSHRGGLRRGSGELAKRNQGGIVEAMVPKYFAATKTEFEEMLKDEQLLYFRVELEKILLRVILHYAVPD